MLPSRSLPPGAASLSGEYKQTMKRAILTATLLAGLVTSGFAWAQANEQIVKERQAPMQALSALLREMKPVADAGNSLASFAPRAEAIHDALRGFNTKFPAGTGPDVGLKTCALEGVWSKPAEFQQGYTALIAQLDKLKTTLRGGDAQAMRNEYAASTQSCGACHGRTAQIAKWPPCG